MDIYEKQELRKVSQDLNFEKGLNADRQKTIALKNRKNENFNSKGVVNVFQEINLTEDWGHFVVITFSIIADIVTLIPFFGASMAFFFSCIFYVIYFLSGQLKNRAVAKIIISSGAYLLEFIGGFFLLGVLPIFTFSAVIIYWLDLKNKQQNKEKKNV